MPFEFSRSRAPRTTQLYQSVWQDFEHWCASMNAVALPASAETALEFLRAREPTHSNSALSARRAAIIAAHKDARSRLPKDERDPYLLDSDDMFKLGWKEINRRKGNRHTPRETVGPDKLRLILAEIPNTLAGAMDRAILLTSLAYAMRRSEVAALNRDDIDIVGDSMFLTIRRSKTDQMGNGVTLTAIRAESREMCPVAAMEAWLEKSGIPADDKGPLFAHPRFKERRRIDPTYSYLLMKRYGLLALGDNKRLGSHSLRRGFIQTALMAKVPLPDSMAAARHRTPNIHLSYAEGALAEQNQAVAALARAL